MNIAVLGTGFGVYHTELFAKMTDVEKITVWGRNAEKLRELQDKFHVQTTTNMEEIWCSQEIDLVDICLPNHLHKEMAIMALRAGKHVFIETPVAETREDAEAILKAGQQYGRRVFVDLFLRFEYAYVYLYNLVKSNQYGRLIELQVKRETPPWWGNLDSRHIGLNLMMHDMDFVVRIMGEAEKVTATQVDVTGEQSIVAACMKYKDAHAFIRGASCMPATHPFSVGYEAIMEQGTVRYYEDGYADGQMDTKLEVYSQKTKEEIPLQHTDCYEAVIGHVLKCIKENQPSCLDIEEAVCSLKAVLAMNEALR